jgi:hypothetical protein
MEEATTPKPATVSIVIKHWMILSWEELVNCRSVRRKAEIYPVSECKSALNHLAPPSPRRNGHHISCRCGENKRKEENYQKLVSKTKPIE